jgi:hypothetical protein
MVKPGLAQEDGGEEKAETTTPAQPSADHHQHQDTSGETNQDDQQQPGKHQWLLAEPITISFLLSLTWMDGGMNERELLSCQLQSRNGGRKLW